MHDNVCKLVNGKLEAMTLQELEKILTEETSPAVTSILEGIRNETARKMARPMIYQAALSMLLEKSSPSRAQVIKYSERMARELNEPF